MKNILDPSFRYTTAAKTDLRKTFSRIRKEQKATDQRDRDIRDQQILKVRRIG